MNPDIVDVNEFTDTEGYRKWSPCILKFQAGKYLLLSPKKNTTQSIKKMTS